MREKLYTPEQVAKEFQLHHLTVLNLIKSGKLKASRLGRVYRIRESEIENFLNKNAI